jgi:hypothetical protein
MVLAEAPAVLTVPARSSEIASDNSDLLDG